MNNLKSIEKQFDDILHTAFREQIKRELDTLPSKEELDSQFTVTEENRNNIVKLAKKQKPIYMKYLQSAAVIALAVVTASFGVLMTNDDIRAGVLEKGVKWFDEYVQFNFGKDKSDYTINFDNVEIGYIPEGYELVYTDISPDSMCNIYYNSTYNSSISIDVLKNLTDIDLRISDSFIAFDQIIINGFNGYSSYDNKNNCSLIVWGNSHFQIYVIGDMPLEALKEIVSNIKY